jgi:hypothetical protein
MMAPSNLLIRLPSAFFMAMQRASFFFIARVTVASLTSARAQAYSRGTPIASIFVSTSCLLAGVSHLQLLTEHFRFFPLAVGSTLWSASA